MLSPGLPFPPPTDPRKVTHEDVIAAMERLEAFVDITEDGLLRLHASLTKRVEERTRAGRSGRTEA